MMKLIIKTIKYVSDIKNSLMAYGVPLFLFTTNCKYHPSCSQYAVQALESYGFWKGSLMAIGRLARCNIGSKGGADFA
jgi:putative membrane protein insertion efficiency factor